MSATRTSVFAVVVGCALLLAACGGDGGEGNSGGDGLTQKFYQGTQPSLGDLDVGVGNILESGAQFSVFGHDPDAETSEKFTDLQEGTASPPATTPSRSSRSVRTKRGTTPR